MTDREHNQADLLDRFMDNLSSGQTVPPDDLDPALASVTVLLAAELTPPEPSTRFVRGLEQRLVTLPVTTNNHHATLPPSGDSELSVTKAGSGWNVMGTPRRSPVREFARLAAAVLAIMLIGSVLIFLFSEREDELAPGAGTLPGESERLYVVAWNGVTVLDPSAGTELYSVDASNPYAALSPDGSRLYVIGAGGIDQLVAFNAATGDELWRSTVRHRLYYIPGGGGPSILGVSPDGSQIYVHSYDNVGDFGSYGQDAVNIPTWVHVIDAGTGEHLFDTEKIPGYCHAEVFASALSGLIHEICMNTGLIRISDSETGDMLETVNAGPRIIAALPSPDQENLYLIGNIIRVFDTDTPQILDSASPDGLLVAQYPFGLAALSPEGNLLYIGLRSNNSSDVQQIREIAVLDTSNWTEVDRIAVDVDLKPGPLGVSADGQSLYAAEQTGSETIGKLVEIDIATGETRTILTTNSEILRVFVSPRVTEHEVPAPRPDEILVSWDPHGGEDYKLFVVHASTGEIHKLTPGPAEGDGVSERFGRWSPDGQRVAFVRLESGDAHLLVSSASGGEPLDLSAETGIRDVSEFSWSPDGTQLAARGQNAAGAYGIHIIDADGSDASLLVADGDGTTKYFPEWSPDGRQVAFIGGEGRAPASVYVVDIGNLTTTPITDGIGAASLRWSPDGSRIAVTAGRIFKSVLVMYADGSGLQRLTHPEAFVLSPAQWSPDGNTLVFAFSDPAPPIEHVTDGTVVARIDGLWRPLTEIAGVPEWSPDGTQVAILTSGITQQGMNTHQSSLYIVNEDGSNLYALLEDVSLAYDPPVWRPVSDPIEPQPASTPTPQVVATPVDEPVSTPEVLTEPPRASLTYEDQTRTHGAHTYCWPEPLSSGEMGLLCSEVDRGPPDLPAIHVPNGVSLTFAVEGGHAFTPLGAEAVRLIPYSEPSPVNPTFDFPGEAIPFEQGPDGTIIIADVLDGDYSFEVGNSMDVYPDHPGNASYAFRVIVGDAAP